MRINRDRVLAAAGAALAMVPGAFVPGVPWWVIASAVGGTFLTMLARAPEVISPTPPPAPPPVPPEAR